MSPPLALDLGTANSLAAALKEDGLPEALPDMTRPDRSPLIPMTVCMDDVERMYLVISALAARKEDVRQVLFTLPDDSEEALKKIMTDAAGKAGLEVQGFVDQTFAAALAYSILSDNVLGKTVVIHLGAGHFKAALYQCEKNITPRMIASRFTRDISGLQITRSFVDKMLDEITLSHGDEVLKDPVLVQRIFMEVEKGKCAVSHRGSYDLKFKNKANDFAYEKSISRFEVEDEIRGLVERASHLCTELLQESSLSASEIDHVVFVGGGSRMPVIQDMCEKIFKQKGSSELNVDQVVALGAALHARKMTES